MTRHPLAAIPEGRRARVFVPVFLATLAVGAALAVIDQSLRTAASPHGIVSFEVAGDVTNAGAMIAAWDTRARSAAGVSLGLDYLFMPLYGTAVALGCLWAGAVFRRRGSALAALGAPLAWGGWFAAALDAIENAALTTQLLDGARAPWPAVAFWAATPKFVLIVAGLLYAAAASVARSRPSA